MRYPSYSKYSQADNEYIIILCELDTYETDILFEYTRRMKAGVTTVKEEKAKASASPASSEDGKGSEKGKNDSAAEGISKLKKPEKPEKLEKRT